MLIYSAPSSYKICFHNKVWSTLQPIIKYVKECSHFSETLLITALQNHPIPTVLQRLFVFLQIESRQKDKLENKSNCTAWGFASHTASCHPLSFGGEKVSLIIYTEWAWLCSNKLMYKNRLRVEHGPRAVVYSSWSRGLNFQQFSDFPPVSGRNSLS